MPTYEYVCSKCGHEFEKYQSIADKSLTTCPRELCARKKWARGKVKRKISTGGGLIFKGTGFYTTDYRSDKYNEAAKKDSAASSAASGPAKKAAEAKSTPAKTETKPAKAPAKT
jgi:putative FmdB family regulatory protein